MIEINGKPILAKLFEIKILMGTRRITPCLVILKSRYNEKIILCQSGELYTLFFL